jgi:hypothetical protein
MLLLYFLATASFAADDTADRPKYCDEPEYLIRGEPEKHASPRDEDLLNPEEQADPALAQQLAASPGPYGHSELGFRYLARLFGYPGRFGSQKQIEDWIMLQEAQDPQMKKGLWQVWEHWVVNSPKRLSVPRGPVRELPLDGNPDMFFLDIRDRAAHARCLKVELSAQFCVNYLGRDRPLKPKDMVHYASTPAGADKFGYCTLTEPPWRIAQEKRDNARAVNGADLRNGVPAAEIPESEADKAAKAAKSDGTASATTTKAK